MELIIKKQITTVWKYKATNDKTIYYVAKVIVNIDDLEYMTLLFIKEGDYTNGYLFNPIISSLQVINEFECISDDCIKDNEIVSIFQQITSNKTFLFRKSSLNFTWVTFKI